MFLGCNMMLHTETYTDMTYERSDRGFESHWEKTLWRSGNALHSILLWTDNKN